MPNASRSRPSVRKRNCAANAPFRQSFSRKRLAEVGNIPVHLSTPMLTDQQRPMNEPLIDSTAEATLVVSSNDLASALPLEPCDTFPAVFATSRMVALMEIAS